jgi:hypothetical protein
MDDCTTCYGDPARCRCFIDDPHLDEIAAERRREASEPRCITCCDDPALCYCMED